MYEGSIRETEEKWSRCGLEARRRHANPSLDYLCLLLVERVHYGSFYCFQFLLQWSGFYSIDTLFRQRRERLCWMMTLLRLLSRVDHPITLRTPPSSSGCFLFPVSISSRP